jgi:hypothetical protein
LQVVGKRAQVRQQRLRPFNQKGSIAHRCNGLQTECDPLAGIQAKKVTALVELKYALLNHAFCSHLMSSSNYEARAPMRKLAPIN